MSVTLPTSTAESSWIAGAWRQAGATFQAFNPAQGTPFAHLAAAGKEDVDDAVASATVAFDRHRRETAHVRAGWCRSAAAAIRTHQDQLAIALSNEHGKPITEARAEVLSSAHGFDVAANTVLTTSGEVPVVNDASKRVIVRREGIGVWAVITPWNFPLNIPVEYIAPALAGGNAVVWKPAPTTSAVAALFRAVLLEADFPQELLQLIITDQVDVASHLATHPGITGVGFTGGSSTGHAIARSAWDKQLLLELGGNSPVVVLSDADLDAAADAISNSAFFNAGQVCSAAGKILAAADCAEELATKIAERAESRILGDPLDAQTTMGPLHLEASITRVESLLADAVDNGASILAGGSRIQGESGFFYPATVIAGVAPRSRIFAEETFGPVASISSFRTEAELVAAANQGHFGLVGALFTSNVSKAFSIAERIDCGLVVVNDTSNYWELNLPFGGASGRQSGRGRLGGRWALEEFTQVKTIAMDIR
jgi:acyl-CoA reductase-like NAD-dependent aldehyde dehydrogenase